MRKKKSLLRTGRGFFNRRTEKIIFSFNGRIKAVGLNNHGAMKRRAENIFGRDAACEVSLDSFLVRVPEFIFLTRAD